MPTHRTTRHSLKRSIIHGLASITGAGQHDGLPDPQIRRIVVVRQHDQLGDMLCAVPLLRCLRAAYADAQITLVASPVNHDIMLHHPFVDRLLLYDKRVLRSSVSESISFLRQLRAEPVDLAIVPATVSMSVTSDLLGMLCKARIRIGAASLNGRENPSASCHTLAVDLDWSEQPHRHQALRNLDILAPLGLSCGDISHAVGTTEQERHEANRRLHPQRDGKRLLLGFHPGAGKPGNRWAPSHFATVINAFCREYDAAAVMTIGPMDTDVRDALLPLLDAPVTVLDGLPIREIAAMISCLDLFLTNDTGIMHVAAGTGIPTLSLFGPTDPAQWAPVGERMHHIRAGSGDIDDIGTGEVIGMLKWMTGNLPGRSA